MRQAGSFDSESVAKRFLQILQHKKIDGKIDTGEGGQIDVWIYNEDDLEKAKKLLQHFQKDPKHSDFDVAVEEPVTTQKDSLAKELASKRPPDHQKKLFPGAKIAYYPAALTRLLILVCVGLFILGSYQQAIMLKARKNLETFFPVITPLQSTLLYDYPETFALMTQFNQEYPISSTEEISTLSPEGKKLLDQIEKTPYWPGFYEIFLNWSNRDFYFGAPLFGSLLQGEVWRLITPIFLHVNILHILFNMLWLWLLGKMMETNLGKFKLICFIVVSAVLTNTLQYLATGPLFMGFSGVISAMAGYIFVRKKIAPWEMYFIDNSTIIFLWIFIFGLLALQIIAFFLQIFHIVSFQMRLANTAHVSGLLFGCLLARVKFFTRAI